MTTEKRWQPYLAERLSNLRQMREFSDVAAPAAFNRLNVTFKKVIAVCILGFLAVQVHEVSAIDSDCNFSQFLQPGLTYYVYNPGYPQQYTPPRSCRWATRSSYRVRLTCPPINLSYSNDCSADNIEVAIGNGIVRRHCGNEWFVEHSLGNEMNITFSAGSRQPGSFLCALQVITPNDENCRCGWRKPTRIVGGVETGINEFTMMAGLINSDNRLLYCGATIITPKHVVTAAHCLNNIRREILGVIVGEHDVRIGNETSATVLYRALNWVIHPRYNENTLDFDVAIIEVDGTITFSNEVGPVCLPFIHWRDSLVGLYITLLGWGATEFAGAKSDYLQQTSVSVISNDQCQSYYPTVTNRQICTFENGKDACQFDSGGPGLWMNPTSRRLVFSAIISSGRGCAFNDPGVNTRVGAIVSWILERTLGYLYCMKE